MNKLNIDTETTFQEIDGFGTSITDSSAFLLSHYLTKEKQDELLRQLFSREYGIGLSVLRQPIGPTDFSLQNFSYAPIDDVELTQFSISYDEEYTIPLIKQALRISPQLKIIATPWSAPAWMKDSGTLNGGSLRPDCFSVYAQYLTKWILEYQHHGIPMYALTLQNEPDYSTSSYPSMRLTMYDEAQLANELALAFAHHNVTTKLLGWDHNWSGADRAADLLDTESGRANLAGVAFHGYAGTVEQQELCHQRHPNKEIYLTECSGGEWSDDFMNSIEWDAEYLLIGALTHWSRTVVKWNLMLDEQHGPHNGGCTDCRGLITLNRATQSMTYNPEYYALEHGGKWVPPGSRRVQTSMASPTHLRHIGFLTPRNETVLLVLNKEDSDEEIEICVSGRTHQVNLTAHSFRTIVIPHKSADIQQWVTTSKLRLQLL